MYTGMLHTHKLVVTLFLLHYIIKFALLMLNKNESLAKYTAKTKVIEMIISVLFLVTGIYLATNSGNIGNWFYAKIAAVAVSIPVAIVGFKKQNKALATMAIMLIIYAYGVSETKAPFMKPDKTTVTTPEGSDGKAIYESKCMNCHGADGKLGLSGAKDLSVSVLSHDEKKEIIMNGKGNMMGFKTQMNDEQAEAVIKYIDGLK
jgi:mono/diheme cytochrome c family protein